MSEPENFTPLRKGESPNGHDPQRTVVHTGSTILTRRLTVVVEEDKGQHTQGRE